MSDLPRSAISRSIRLARLPLGLAGREVVGLTKRLGGKSAEAVIADVQQRTAEQVFRVLGELKGGAMKFGQMLSVLEAGLPEQVVGPYRAALTKLQEAAPPMPAATVHEVLESELGPRWRSRLRRFDDTAAAAASIGQVHRASWPDGTPVAVKIQYPGAAEALRSDLEQVGRLARVLALITPGIEVRPLVAEMRARITEELDYGIEADAQRRFAATFAGDPDVVVPRVRTQTAHVLVTDWLEGRPLASVIADGDAEARDRAGLLLARFLFSGPARAGLLHGDPHPGNFRLLPDGRLGVLDYGLVARLPGGLPRPIGRLLRIALHGDFATVLDGLRAEGFVKPQVQIDPADLYGYLNPFLEPARAEKFHFTRRWMREQVQRVADVRDGGVSLALKLNLPPSYLIIHRVWTGSIGVLAQLDATVPIRAEMERFLPGFADGGLSSGADGSAETTGAEGSADAPGADGSAEPDGSA